ncbi:unnamed protein product [Lepeophtheirus salmonis]|uniref:(salmon louse) hypothetical protein n=1 Tax=Lepeophtheirus salmonis TaxID=72036 RepID=A0A7R8CKS7_LEPSM|nr:unnamed protein product [Lepeophtheirus salmonis]CAF2847882.1 unnamed protein product [Lepeophtheirus salmonis]
MSSIFVYCEGANPSHRPPYTIGANPYIGPTESIVASWAAGICAVLGLFGNILSVVVFTSNDKLKKHSTTPFLLSLAISDLIFSGFNLPLLSLRYYYRDWKFGYGTCELFPFFYYSNISVTTFSMGLISLNRFIGIFYPEKLFKIFTPVSCAGMISGVWIISMGLMLLPFFEIWGHLGYEPKNF